MQNKFTPLLIIFVICGITVFGQDKTMDTTLVEGWFPNAVAGLNVSQLALSNWTQGGDNSITWTATLNGGLKYYSPGWKLDNNIKMAYGRTKLGGQDFRTNDNEFYLESVLSKKIDWDISPYFSNSIRTSITTGYTYSANSQTPIADFFDPGYVRVFSV